MYTIAFQFVLTLAVVDPAGDHCIFMFHDMSMRQLRLVMSTLVLNHPAIPALLLLVISPV